MNINDRRESTPSGRVTWIWVLLCLWESVSSLIYWTHSNSLISLTAGRSDPYALKHVTAHCQKICSTLQLRAWYSNSLIFSSFPAMFFPVLSPSCLPSLLPSFFPTFSSYLNESSYSRNYWELGTLDPILISTCWIYFLSVTKNFPLSLYSVQISFTKGMYR